MALTAQQVDIVKSTAPVVAQYGEAITTKMYAQMLSASPELNALFNQSNQRSGHQQRALAGALYAYASNIDNLAALGPTVELIANKHASLYIRPEHYHVVGAHLLSAMGQVLGDALTPEILDAWTAAYWQLADVFVQREKQLYQKAPGHWQDWRKFRIAKKEKESEEITSFYLEPVDGETLASFLPGQYVSVQTKVRQYEWKQSRQYSLSDAPRLDYYRISVKKEKGLDPGSKMHPGFISNILHDGMEVGDEVEVSYPYGDFYLDPEKTPDGPVVLISAGVGLTCLLSIFNTLLSRQELRPISWIHGSRTEVNRAFGQHVREAARTRNNVRVVLFTKNPTEREVRGLDFHHEGRVDLDRLDKEQELHLGNPEAQYFICGPESFMTDVEVKLKSLGVRADRVHMELFGTGGIPRDQGHGLVV